MSHSNTHTYPDCEVEAGDLDYYGRGHSRALVLGLVNTRVLNPRNTAVAVNTLRKPAAGLYAKQNAGFPDYWCIK